MPTIDPIELNILGVNNLIGSRLNKSASGVTGQEEGVASEKIDALDLPMTDDELIALSKKWEVQYAPYEAKIEIKQKTMKAFYLGMQEAGSPKANTYQMPVADNLIFEAVETFVPAALAKNPEPVVFTDDTTEGQEVADSVKTVLQYHADTLNLRGQCTLIIRKWLVDLLGVMKHGWDDSIGDLWDDVRDVKDFVFDTEGYVDLSGDFVGYLGERVTVSAEKLVELFPKHTAYITIMVEGKMGTRCTYTEWWNDDYTFTTFKSKILDKSRNPNFKYDKDALNHFGRPKKPYTFFSVYSLADQPHDITSLIEQNIANQKVISRRSQQIDFNLSRQNNSDIFSGNNWTQETAKQAATAIKEGHPVIVPSGGPIKESIERLPAQGIDAGFFSDLQARKQSLRMSFGTEGITAQAPEKDELATGLMLNKEHDVSRISGSIGDALERFVKGVFNQHVQFYYVYYDTPHYGMILGQMKAVQYKQLQQEDFMNSNGEPRRLVVSVSPDSMKPHDEITEMNQALELWKDEALDPKTLLIRVKFPDPDKTAEQVILWKLNPMAYAQKNYPELAQFLQQNAQPDPEQQKAQADVEVKKADIEFKKQEAQIDLEKAKQDMSLEMQKAQLEMQIAKIEAQQKIELSRAEGENKLVLQEEQGKQKLTQGEESHKAKIEQAKSSAKEKEKLSKTKEKK